jgi:hypothetical protein
MMLEEEDELIQHVLANHDAAVAGSTTHTATSEGTLVEQEVDESDFTRSNGSPLSSYNRFACLEVDTQLEPFTCAANSTEVMQTHSHPPNPPIPN